MNRTALALLLTFTVAGCSSTAPAPSKDATAVIADLKAAGLPIGAVNTYTEASDPNKLLGRPGGYTSGASFVDTTITDQADGDDLDRGGVVEVYADEAGAKKRADYVLAIVKELPLVTQYVERKGKVVLRLSRSLTPTQEKVYVKALG
jgi:hypothetical protein